MDASVSGGRGKRGAKKKGGKEKVKKELKGVMKAVIREGSGSPVEEGKREGKKAGGAEGVGEEGGDEEKEEEDGVCGYEEDERFITKQVGTGSSPPLHLALGSARLPPALDLALSHMLTGEKAVVFASSLHTIPPPPDTPLPPPPPATAPLPGAAEPEARTAEAEAGNAEAGRLGLAAPVVVVPAPPEGVVDVQYHVQLVKIVQVGAGGGVKRWFRGRGETMVMMDECIHTSAAPEGVVYLEYHMQLVKIVQVGMLLCYDVVVMM
ncbi:unnamed protein product [Closterium sp. Yama58-4]|nr:unnamed protein product [Closterium sp. Yama58-4]